MSFLNELRDFVKYVVHKNNSQMIIKISKKKDFHNVKIVINNAK